MGPARRQLLGLGLAVTGSLAVVILLGGPAVGLSRLPNIAGLSVRLGRLLILFSALLLTLFFFRAVLGPNLSTRLFFVRNKALTLNQVNDLRAKENTTVTVPIAPGQGVLRIIPIKPEWWLDDAYPEKATPVIAVEDVEHRVPGWAPYDVVVQAGTRNVVAWLPRRSGNRGRRIYNPVHVPQGQVTAVVFRPSSVPELGGTLETLDLELTGNLSLFRLTVATALLGGIAYTVWRLTAG